MASVWNLPRCDWCGAAIQPEHINPAQGHSFCPFCEGITPLNASTTDIPLESTARIAPPLVTPIVESSASGSTAEASQQYCVTTQDDGLLIQYTRPLSRLTLAALALFALIEIAVAVAFQSIAAYVVTSFILMAYFIMTRIKNTVLLTVTHNTIVHRVVPFPWLPKRTLHPTQLWVQRTPSSAVRDSTYQLMATDQLGRSFVLIPFGHSVRDMRALEYRIEQHLTITNRPVPGEVEHTHEP